MKKIKIIVGISIVSLSYMFCGTHTFLKEIGSFTSAIIRSHKTMGTIAPSSSHLGKKMANKILNKRSQPIRILEVGGGSGSITEEIIKKMGVGDKLDVIEIDSELCKVLERKFKQHENVTIHCLSILDWKTTIPYDFIISSLPFNSLEFEFVSQVIDKYLRLIVNGGIISYLEYMGLAYLKKGFLGALEKNKFIMLHDFLINFRNTNNSEMTRVVFNLPPANVYHIKVKK